MSGYKLTPEEKATRTAARAARRHAMATAKASTQAWFHSLQLAASKSAKARAKEARKQPRGVDRVPAHLRGLHPTIEKHEYSKRGNRIDSTPKNRWAPTPKKRRQPRRRDLPGAVARREARLAKQLAEAK